MLQNNYTLNPYQVEALKSVHKKIMESGLIRMGIPNIEHGRFIETSDKTFDLIIQEAQILLEEKEEKQKITNDLKKN